MSDWFRNLDWNDAIEEDFFARLKRSRSQRDQYLVIQALHLANTHPEVTLRLVDHYFQTRTDDFHDPRARQAVATARFALGGYAEALDAYQAALSSPSGDNGLQVASPIDFAFLAARHRSNRHYEAALAVVSDLALPDPSRADARFRLAAGRALILLDTGRDPSGAQLAARTALDLPDAVLAQYPDLVWRLRGITRR